MDLGDSLCDLAFRVEGRGRVDQPHVSSELNTLTKQSDERRTLAGLLALRLFHFLDQRLDGGLFRVVEVGFDDANLVALELGARQVEHVGRLRVHHLTDDRHQFRHVDELRERLRVLVRAAIGRQFALGDDLAERGGPAIEIRYAVLGEQRALQVTLHGVELGHSIRDRRPR